MSGTGDNYEAGLAAQWASTDPLEQWVNAAPHGGTTPIEETVREYLGDHNPFPDETAVEVLRHDRSAWDPAVIVERVGVDEWTVSTATESRPGAAITICVPRPPRRPPNNRTTPAGAAARQGKQPPSGEHAYGVLPSQEALRHRLQIQDANLRTIGT